MDRAGYLGFVHAMFPVGPEIFVAQDGLAATQTMGPVARTEQRLACMIAYTRVATTLFLAIPLFGWHRLRYPLIAVLALVAAVVEAGWFLRRVLRRRTIRDRLLLSVDVAFCMALMLIGSRAALPVDRNTMTTEFVPFGLVASAALGVGAGLRPAAALAVHALFEIAERWTVPRPRG